MNLSINPEQEEKRIAVFIKNVLAKTNAAGVVVATSGGIDSATTLALTVRAIGKEKTHALLLPCGNLSKDASSRAKQHIGYLGLIGENVSSVDIEQLVSSSSEALGLVASDTLRRGNIMARLRMIVVFDYAKKHNLLVAGTENKSEYLLGYFTRFGDEASDFEPIRHLYKTQIYQLAKYLDVSEDILSAKPTANLWENQTDEEELGFTYKDADLVLTGYFDELKSIAEIEKEFPSAGKVIAYSKKNNFKHEVPYLPDFTVDD